MSGSVYLTPSFNNGISRIVLFLISLRQKKIDASEAPLVVCDLALEIGLQNRHPLEAGPGLVRLPENQMQLGRFEVEVVDGDVDELRRFRNVSECD